MKICSSCKLANALEGEKCESCGADLSRIEPSRGNDLVGGIIAGKYQLDQFVGEGGMAWVYRGSQEGLERPVAIKLMKRLPQHEEMSLRFAREARLAAALSHPNIIRIFDFGDTAGGNLFLVSEFLEGQTLDALLAGGPVHLGRAMLLFSQVLDAVEEAHVHGVVHRDLKPENIMLAPLRSGAEMVKILDFGIATLAEDPSPKLTADGMLVGTPAFMAPELFDGIEASPGSDLYACGLLLFELLTGVPAIRGKNLAEVIEAQRADERPSLQAAAPEQGFTDCLERALAGALAREPAERYLEIADFRQALQSCNEAAPHLHSALYPAVNLNSLPAPAPGPARPPRPVRPSSSVVISAGSLMRPSLRALLETADTPDNLMNEPSRPSPTPATMPPPRRSTQTGERLVGRGREVAFLENRDWRESPPVEVIGAAGLGKSALLMDVSRRLRAQDTRTVLVGAAPAGVRPPWHPIRSLVAQVLGLSADAPPRDTATAARAAGVEPADERWLVHLRQGAADTQVKPEVRHREICAAVLNLLQTVQARSPLAVMLDDVDLYDGASLSLVRQLAARPAHRRPALVLAGAATVLGQDSKAARLLMGPLSPEACRELLNERCDGALAEVDIEVLARRLPGNPLCLELAVDLVVQGGQLDGASAPPALVRAHFEMLPEAAQQLLVCLSIMGGEARLEELTTLAGAGATDHAPALATLEEHRLITLKDDLVRVCHPMVSAQVHDLTDEAQHTERHRAAFSMLKASGAGTFDQARHTVEGALHSTSLGLLQRAAEEAAAHWSHPEVIFFRRTACEVARWDLKLPGSSLEYLRLRLGLGEALLEDGRHKSAANTFASSLKQVDEDSPEAVRIGLGLARAQAGAGHLGRARKTLAETSGRAMRLAHPTLLCETYQDLAQLLVAVGRWQEALAEAEEGLSLLGDGGEAHETWRLRALAALCQEQLGALDQAAALARQCVRDAASAGAPDALAGAQLQQGRLLCRVGNMAEGIRLLSSALAGYEDMGDRRGQAESLLARAEHAPAERSAIATRAARLAAVVCWREGVALAGDLGAVSAPPRRGGHHSFD